MAKRDGFIVHEKTLRQMSRLSPEDAGYLMGCLTTYYYDGDVDIDSVAEVSVAVAVILEDAVERMDADIAAFEKSVEQRRKAAEKRWDNAKDMREDAKVCESMRPHNENMREVCENVAKNAVSVSVSDSVSVIKENSLTESKRKVFKPPTVDAVLEYCVERNNNVDAQQFVDFYASKGWRVGNQSMKDWKACVRTWERRNTKPRKNAAGQFANFEQRNDPEHNAMVAKLIALQ